MIGDNAWYNEFDRLDDLAMGYEVAAIPLFESDYLREFYDLYEIVNRKARLTCAEESFEQVLLDVSGAGRWEAVAQKTRELYGPPKRVMVFDDVVQLREELEGPSGLAPFFFVFDLMFCEYDGFALCFMSGTNN